MRDRRFGVEIEFNSNNVGNVGIGDAFVRAGLRSWVGDLVQRDGWSRNDFYYTLIGYDGSELEIRSPILKGESGFKQLKKAIGILNNFNCFTTTSDGLHVHHDAPEFVDSKEMVTKLIRSWADNQEHIVKFIAPERAARCSGGYGPAAALNEQHLTRFEEYTADGSGYDLRGAISYGLPRGSLNCRALYEHGSIEIRYHEGTLDWDNIESWILFGQSFLNSIVARKKPLEKTENPVVLMNRLRTRKKAHNALLVKAIKNGHSLYDVGLLS